MFSASCDFVSTAPYSYKFGPSSGTALLTMTVADYSRQALLRQCCCIEVRESSSGKNAFFPTMHLLHLHLGFRVASGFILFSRLTHLQMPYAVSVRQVSGLPPASFRSRLAADTLALGYVLGATPCTRDFHPLERAHGAQTKSPVCTYLCKPGLYLTYLVTIKLYQFRNFISCFLHRFFKFSKADICLFGCYIYF